MLPFLKQRLAFVSYMHLATLDKRERERGERREGAWGRGDRRTRGGEGRDGPASAIPKLRVRAVYIGGNLTEFPMSMRVGLWAQMQNGAWIIDLPPPPQSPPPHPNLPLSFPACLPSAWKKNSIYIEEFKLGDCWLAFSTSWLLSWSCLLLQRFHLWSLQWVISTVYYKNHHLGESASVS